MTIANHPEAEFSENFDQINYEMEAHVNDRYTQTEGVEIRFKTWWIAFTHFIVARPFDLLYMDQVTSTHLYPKVGSQPSMAFYGETRNIFQSLWNCIDNWVYLSIGGVGVWDPGRGGA